jgi:ribosomal protein S24E
MSEIQKLEEELNKRKAKIKELEKQLSQAEDRQDVKSIKSLEKKLELEEQILETVEDRLDLEKLTLKNVDTQLKSYSRLSKEVKARLSGDANSADLLKDQLRTLGKLKAKQDQLSKDADFGADDILDTRVDYYDSITKDIITQVKENQSLADKLKGQTDFEMERKELATAYSSLKDDVNRKIMDELEKEGKILSIAQIKSGFGGKELKEKAELLDELDREEKIMQELLLQKEKHRHEGLRLQEIQEMQGDLMSELPGPIKESIGFVKKLGVAMKAGFGPLMIAGAVLLLVIKSFKDLDDAAKDFRDTTGLTNSQMEGIRSDVNAIVSEFAGLGIEAKDVFNTISALKSEFGDVVGFSREVVAGLSVLGANFGVLIDDAAATQAIFENIGGLSSETAVSVQLQVANMAKLAGVAPAKVFADIAESAEIASTFFKGDIQSLAKAAIEARRLGTTVQRTADIAKGLLDFESSITSELEASAILGQSINFNKARGLAFDGDTIGAQKEILNQIRSIGNFQELDIFQKEAIANASGMTVEEISKQLKMGEKLASLSKEERDAAESAMEMGLDITNIKKEDLATQIKAFSTQQEQQAVLDQISNQFTGIASTVGSVLVPLLETILPIINGLLIPVTAIATGFRLMGDYLSQNIPLLSTLAALLLVIYRRQIATAIGSIFSSFAKIPLGLGIPLAVASVVGMVSMISDAFKPVGDMTSPADGRTRVSTKEGGLFELSPNDDLIAAPGLLSQSTPSPITSTVATTPNTTNMSELIQEIRGLRKDLNDGKVAVYMDGRKVTASVSRVVDRMGTNMYG